MPKVTQKLVCQMMEEKYGKTSKDAQSLTELADKYDKILDKLDDLLKEIYQTTEVTDQFHHYSLPFLFCMRDAFQYSMEYRLKNNTIEPWIERKKWCYKTLEKCFKELQAPEEKKSCACLGENRDHSPNNIPAPEC